jgi:hypothetical protein
VRWFKEKKEKEKGTKRFGQLRNVFMERERQRSTTKYAAVLH